MAYFIPRVATGVALMAVVLSMLFQPATGAPPPAETAVEARSLRWTIVPEKQANLLDAPIKLRLIGENLSQDAVDVGISTEAEPFTKNIKFDPAPAPPVISPAPTTAPHLVELPGRRIYHLDKKESLYFEFPLTPHFQFNAAGEYKGHLTLGRVDCGAVSIPDVVIPFEITVVKASLAGIPGHKVDLVPGDGSAALVWTMVPMDRIPLPEPEIDDGNCRIVVRTQDGKLLLERFWQRSGMQVAPDKWTQALGWRTPVNEFSDAPITGFLGLAAGTYLVEASYRDFVRRDQSPRHITAGNEPSPLYLPAPLVNIPLANRTDGQLLPDEFVWPKHVRSTDLPGLAPIPGRWITFTTSYVVEIASDGSIKSHLAPQPPAATLPTAPH